MQIESFIYNHKQQISLNYKPTLAFLFFEVEKKSVIEDLYKQLMDINPKMEIIGVNGHNGNISSNIPFITKPYQISCLFFDIDKNYFKIEIIDADKNFKSKLFKGMNYFQNSASIMFPPFRYDINDFLDSIDENEMNDIYGGVYGLTNDIGAFYNGIFCNDKIITIFFNQEIIKFSSLAIHGFKPIGLKFKVTKAEKNVIYELNDLPALDVIEDYIGEIKQKNIDSFLHPFCVYHKGYESLASIKNIDRDTKSITFYKYIYEGENIRITIPSNQNSIVNYLDETLKNIDCDGLFMFSCVGRYAYYKELISFEIAKVSEVIDKPIAGFLTYGEIGSNEINTKSILQNQTMDLVFFKVLK